MLRAENLEFRRGAELLFQDLNFVIHPGQRVAIAGRNGVGKTTLFQMIRGHAQPESGDLIRPEGWHVGYMEQESAVTQRPALEYVVDGHKTLRAIEEQLTTCTDPSREAQLHANFQDLGGYEAHARAGEILHGLGFSQTDFDKSYAAFSGGWRIRLNLAQALMTPCDLLLLDEPTNHLDLEAIMWLEGWLARFEGTALVIAHDRAFLDASTDHTLYLSNQSGRLYSGNYSACERQRAEYLQQQMALTAKQATQKAHIQKFVDRFRAKASKAKQVQSRVKALERLADSAVIQLDSPYTATFQNPQKVSNPLFSLRNVDLGYTDKTILSNVNLSILPGARIGVLGANGAGKSTLLKALVGAVEPQQGELIRGNHCEVGYFAQHQLETLDPSLRALPMLTDTKPSWREQQCRDYLGRWGFNAGMIERPIATLSGGEKARLVLAIIALKTPAILILDEPTNHLDLDMRDALAFALQDFAGAVVIVSHDRILLDKTVDDFWVVDNGALQVFRGDLHEYTTARSASFARTSQGNAHHSRKSARQDRANHRASLKHLRDAVKKIEREMDQQSQQLQVIEQQLADTETYAKLSKPELESLLAQAGKLRRLLNQSEEAWLTINSEIETISD